MFMMYETNSNGTITRVSYLEESSKIVGLKVGDKIREDNTVFPTLEEANDSYLVTKCGWKPFKLSEGCFVLREAQIKLTLSDLM